MTLKDAIAEYTQEAIDLRRRSRSWKSHARAVVAFFGGDTLVSEAAAKAGSWVAYCRDERQNSPQTLACKLGFLIQLCRLANEKGVTAKVPRRVSASIVVDNRRERTLSPKELENLKNAFPSEDWYVCEIAMTTGLRTQELFGLTVADCDFAAGTASLRRTKTGRSRKIPMIGPLLEAALKASLEQRTYVVNPKGYDKWNARKVMTEHWKDSVFRPALRGARIEDFRFHDFRHVAVSNMIENGAEQMAVVDIMGWKDPRYLARYTNLRMASLVKAMGTGLAAAQ